MGVGCVWLFIITSEREISRIETRSMEYDRAFTKQIELTDKIDLIYSILTSFQVEDMVNYTAVQNRVSTQKIELISAINDLQPAEAQLYRKYSDMVNPVLQVKDSVRLLTLREQTLRNELLRCIRTSRNPTRNRP